MICVVTTDFIYINFRPKNDAKIGDKCLLWIMIEKDHCFQSIIPMPLWLFIYLFVVDVVVSFSLFRSLYTRNDEDRFQWMKCLFSAVGEEVRANRSFLYMVVHQSCQFIGKGPTIFPSLTYTHVHKRTRMHIHSARIYPCRNIQKPPPMIIFIFHGHWMLVARVRTYTSAKKYQNVFSCFSAVRFAEKFTNLEMYTKLQLYQSEKKFSIQTE